MILQLLDRDLDGIPDQFAYLLPEARCTQDFGFMSDIDWDGRTDYRVFSLAVTQDAVTYWMNCHWIDSTADGRDDIKVNNAVSPGPDRFPAGGMTAGIHDGDFDGYAGKAEYLAPGFVQPVHGTDGMLTVNWLHRDSRISIGAERIDDGPGRILADIHAAMQECSPPVIVVFRRAPHHAGRHPVLPGRAGSGCYGDSPLISGGVSRSGRKKPSRHSRDGLAYRAIGSSG